MTQEPFGDVPLFRELQRLLSAGGGPVNFEIARQVGRAIATESATRQSAGPEIAAALGTGVRDSEVLLAGYTGLQLVEPARVAVTTPVEWVPATLDAWKWLFERLAGRFVEQLTKLVGEQGAGPLQAALDQVSPLLVGMQVGTLIGHLAREALGRYDLPIPRDDDGRLIFVGPNVTRLAADYSLEIVPFCRWLALDAGARHVVVGAVPWVLRYQRSLITEIVDSIEIDATDIERRMMDIQSQGPEALEQGVTPSDLISIAQTDRHQKALNRLRAFLAALQGYASHAAAAVGPEVLPEAARIQEVMTRHRASPSSGQAMLADVLGISTDRTLEQAGQTFSNGVVKLKGLYALNRMWDAADNLPSLEEIRDPFAWMDRVLAE